jgi:transglutaminase-like putative cysteine protease
MRRLALAALFVVVARPAVSQAPRITPSGDPSVRNDTIYKLAVNPADYPDDDYVFLLDDGVIRFEPDGRTSRTYRQVVQILNQDGAEAWGEQSFSYSSGSEKLTVNWIRVLKPTGEVISAQPAHEQESLAPVAFDAPVYSDEKVRRVTLSGVAPGTLVDWSYTVERIKPLVPNDYYTGWRVTNGVLTRRSRLIVDVPTSVKPRIQEENVHFKRLEADGHGRRVYTWATSDVKKIEGEPFAAAPNTLSVHIDIGAPIGWSYLAGWYAGLSNGRYQLNPALETQLAEHVKDAKTLEDSLRAVHRWVSQDFRYVSLSLGIGGYLPRLPAQVLETRYGDCKDKATFFIALARRMGLKAYPVLLSASGSADSTLPTVQQFDHMIAAVDRPQKSGGRIYLDLTSELTPYGELPPAEEGSFALVVHDDSTFEEITLPESAASANRSETRIVGELNGDGHFTGRYVESKTGGLQYGLRRAYARVFSKDELSRLTQALANGVFSGASGDSLTLFDGRDLQAKPEVSLAVHDAPVLSSSGGTRIFTLPAALPNFASLGLASQLERRKPRRFPIDIGAVIGPIQSVSELRMTLPPGWKAELPPNVTESSQFGDYTAEYAQNGAELRVTRRMSGHRGTAPPDSVDALISWLRAISKDNVKFIVLQPAAAEAPKK